MYTSPRMYICNTFDHLVGPALHVQYCNLTSIIRKVYLEVVEGIVLDLNVIMRRADKQALSYTWVMSKDAIHKQELQFRKRLCFAV